MKLTLLVVVCLVATALWNPEPAVAANDLALTAASAVAGGLATVTLELANDDVVAGIQVDILFDSGVAAFSGVTMIDRGIEMIVEGRVVETGRLRLVIFSDDLGALAAGSGSIAELVFSMQGLAGDDCSLVFQDIIVSDPDGEILDASGETGSLTVLDPVEAPTLTVAALKNPGNGRIVQIMVTVVGGSGDLPTVNVGSSSVVMTSLGSGVFLGRYFAPESQTSITITAGDTNSHGTGNAQVILALP